MWTLPHHPTKGLSQPPTATALILFLHKHCTARNPADPLTSHTAEPNLLPHTTPVTTVQLQVPPNQHVLRWAGQKLPTKSACSACCCLTASPVLTVVLQCHRCDHREQQHTLTRPTYIVGCTQQRGAVWPDCPAVVASNMPPTPPCCQYPSPACLPSGPCHEYPSLPLPFPIPDCCLSSNSQQQRAPGPTQISQLFA